MLTRIRLEVSDEASADAVTRALNAHEGQIMAQEAFRFDKSFANGDWEDDAGLHELLGREVTDEVIEYDASIAGYKGRRVVQYRRIDTRTERGPAATEALGRGEHNSITFAAPDKAAA